MELVYLLIGLIVGASLLWLWARIRQQNSQQAIFEQLSQSRVDQSAVKQTLLIREQEIERLRSEAELLRTDQIGLNKETSRWKAEYESLQEKLGSQKREFEELRERFNIEFRNIANDILEEKTKRFTESNKENIDQILKPLKEKITEFELKVDTTHKEGLVTSAALKEQITGLRDLNLQMSKDAVNLTRALKGESKTRGNWGEVILETVLEKSGLTKGREYEIQVNLNDEEGKRFQPDVIIRLPEGKAIVIDAKVSLVGYERMMSAEDELNRAVGEKEHILSLRNHVKGLSAKNYQQLHELKSLDFVLLFIPIEPAFATAVQIDANLFNEAFDRNIVIVSPTTLLATLRTIASIWRQEYQNRNAAEIAKQGGALYDKFVAFTEDLVKVGQQMDTSKKTYEEAMKKLVSGTGNLVKRSKTLLELGVPATKNLSTTLLGRALEDEEL